MPLTPQQLTALAVLGKGASKVRKELAVTGYDLDFTIHVSGTLTVSGDTTVSAASKPSAETIAAVLLGTYGPRKRIALVAQLATADHSAVVVDDELRELAAKLVESLTTRKPSVRAGAVSGSLNAELVS